MEVPNINCYQMNILLWNYRGALNGYFTRRVYEMAVNHFLAIMIITETIVGGDRAAKIIEGFLSMASLSRIPLDMREDFGCSGKKRRWRCLYWLPHNKRSMPL